MRTEIQFKPKPEEKLLPYQVDWEPQLPVTNIEEKKREIDEIRNYMYKIFSEHNLSKLMEVCYVLMFDSGNVSSANLSHEGGFTREDMALA
jgi:hypothetical protein